jgi:hypothetical protein
MDYFATDGEFPCHFVYPHPILNDTQIRNIGSGESVLSASVFDSRVRNNPRKIATYKTADDFIEITMSVLNCTEFLFFLRLTSSKKSRTVHKSIVDLGIFSELKQIANR